MQCHIDKNTLLHIAFSAILPVGKEGGAKYIRYFVWILCLDELSIKVVGKPDTLLTRVRIFVDFRIKVLILIDFYGRNHTKSSKMFFSCKLLQRKSIFFLLSKTSRPVATAKRSYQMTEVSISGTLSEVDLECCKHMYRRAKRQLVLEKYYKIMTFNSPSLMLQPPLDPPLSLQLELTSMLSPRIQ